MANGMNTGPAGPTVMDPSQARAVVAAQAASLGRFQSPEQWFSFNQSFATPSQFLIPRPMPLNRPAESVIITILMRVNVANNNMAFVAPEALQNILQLIQMNGTHRVFGNLFTIRQSGATAYAWPFLFQSAGGATIINGIASADPTTPFVSGFTGLIGSFDVALTYNIPLGPLMGIGQSTKRDLSSFLYQADDWGDSIQLQLNFGDNTALGTPVAAGDVTFTAFGSASGTPLVSVFVNYSILGPFSDAIRSGVIVRQEQLFNQFVTAGTALRISQLQKQITPNVMIKSGTSLAGVTAGVTTFGTLVDNQLERTQVVVDNKPLKFNQSNVTLRAYDSRMFARRQPGGYLNLTFVDGQNPALAYRGDGLAGGSLFELQSDVLTTGATQIQAMTQEMAYGGPFIDLHPGA